MTNELLRLYECLLAHFGPRHWWPGETPWEIAVGAVLTQNTNWRNVERAIAGLKQDGLLADADAIAGASEAELARCIRPAGYYNLKARRLHHLAAWWQRQAPAAADPSTDLASLRSSLLAVNGVGSETADSILLYAFDRCTFVIDAYTRRLLLRRGLLGEAASYDEAKEFFEGGLPRDIRLYNDFHAQIVELGKTFCRPKPRCAECPLRWHLEGAPALIS